MLWEIWDCFVVFEHASSDCNSVNVLLFSDIGDPKQKNPWINWRSLFQNVDQRSLDELRELKAQKEHLETDLNEIRRELEEKEVQNNLLKDSEARLLDSVDEYGAQAER